MTMIFSNFLGDSLEVFMDNFFIFGDNFDSYLAHLTKILEVWHKDLVWSLKQMMVCQRKFIIPNSHWFKNIKSSTTYSSGRTIENKVDFYQKSWLGQPLV